MSNTNNTILPLLVSKVQAVKALLWSGLAKSSISEKQANQNQGNQNLRPMPQDFFHTKWRRGKSNCKETSHNGRCNSKGYFPAHTQAKFSKGHTCKAFLRGALVLGESSNTAVKVSISDIMV